MGNMVWGTGIVFVWWEHGKGKVGSRAFGIAGGVYGKVEPQSGVRSFKGGWKKRFGGGVHK